MSGWLEEMGICPCDLGALTAGQWLALGLAVAFVLFVWWVAAS